MVKISDIIAPNFKPLHYDIVHNRHSNYWLKGGRGSTKSSFISIEIILGIMKDANANAVVIRRYANTLRESVFDQYLWAIDKLGVTQYWQSSVSPLTLTYIPTGQQIRFKGADKPEKIKSVKFRQGYTKYKHYEEITEFSSFDTIRSINQSLTRGGSGIITFYSYNPPASVNSWVNQWSQKEGVRDDTYISESTYLTVPKEWLGDAFIADAEHLKQVNKTKYEHEYLGIVTGTGAEVFTNVTVRKITDEEVRAFDNIKRGLDFGFASDPLAYSETHYDKTRRKLYVFGEIYKVGLSNRQAVELIKQMNPNNELITSDIEPRTVAEFRGMGLRVVPAVKGADSRRQGFKFLQDLDEIIVDPQRCPNATREFTTYELERDKYGNFKPIYPDGNDHYLDSTRYGLESETRKGGFTPWKR